MPVKIEIVNKVIDDNNNECKAALLLKSMMNNSFLKQTNGTIGIAYGLTLCGQETRDIDIAIWGSFSDCELSKFYTNDSKYPKKNLQVRDFCIVIELKEHSADRISFANTHLYAEYNSGKKDVTNQNELQRYSMMNYLNAYCGVNVFVTNIIWLKSVSDRELKKVVGSAPVGILPSAFSFSDLINMIISQGQKPYYEKETDSYVLSATKEIDWMLIQIVPVRFIVHNVSLHRTHPFQPTGIDACIDFHPTGIKHWTNQGIFFLYHLTQKHRNGQQFQSRHTEQWDVQSVADSLSHRNTDTQASIGTWSTADGNSIERDGVTIYKRECFVHKDTKCHRVIRAGMILLAKDRLRIF